MFALHLKQLYRISDKVIIRTLRKGRLAPVGPNPGLDNRLKSFEEKGLQITDGDQEEFIEKYESDFYNVGEAYNEHVKETIIGKHEIRHQIVKEKYFKENMPNLLTWSEKEQIRYLVSTEPNEWTPEKIAESFPVTVPTVKKLLKYAWKPATEERIARHDASVMRNWKELKEGSLPIPKDIRNHFFKFSNRTIPPLRKESIKVELKSDDHLGEFESIVRRCASTESHSSDQEQNVAVAVTSTDDAIKNIKSKKKDTKMMTLEELTTKIKNRLAKGKDVDICDKLIVDSMAANINVRKSEDIKKEIELFYEDLKQKNLVKFKEDEKQIDVMDYPERIRIPKSAYKKGATYKVNDCYYDHDGRFLYRVLGLSN